MGIEEFIIPLIVSLFVGIALYLLIKNDLKTSQRLDTIEEKYINHVNRMVKENE